MWWGTIEENPIPNQSEDIMDFIVSFMAAFAFCWAVLEMLRAIKEKMRDEE